MKPSLDQLIQRSEDLVSDISHTINPQLSQLVSCALKLSKMMHGTIISGEYPTRRTTRQGKPFLTKFYIENGSIYRMFIDPCNDQGQVGETFTYKLKKESFMRWISNYPYRVSDVLFYLNLYIKNATTSQAFSLSEEHNEASGRYP